MLSFSCAIFLIICFFSFRKCESVKCIDGLILIKSWLNTWKCAAPKKTINAFFYNQRKMFTTSDAQIVKNVLISMKTIECGEPCCLCILHREVAACSCACAMCIALSIHARLFMFMFIFTELQATRSTYTSKCNVNIHLVKFVKSIRFEVIEGL